jgi:hypothetical protein
MMVKSFLGQTRRVLRHDAQPRMRHYDAFRTNSLFYLRQIKQHLLDDVLSFSLAADRGQVRSAPIEHPVIRAERPQC